MDSMRLRIKIACEECRKNKRKCQGQRPTCALCEKGGKSCHYPPELSRKYVIVQRKNHDDGYIRNLEDKVKALEAQLEGYRRSEPQSQHNEEHMGYEILPAPVPARIDYKSSPSDETEVIASKKEEGANDPRSQAAMEELASLMLTMDVEDKGEPSFTIPSGKDKYSSRQNKMLSDNLSFGPNHHRVNSAEDGFHPETRRHLVECFMNAFNIYHQFIEQAELPCVLSETMISRELDLSFRNHALLSVGAFLSPQSDSQELSSYHATSAENALLRCIRENPSDLAVQGLALLSWRELMLENNSMAYSYIGLILHLGLHVSNLSPGKPPDLASSLTSTTDDYIHYNQLTESRYAFEWADLKAKQRQNLLNCAHKALKDFYAGIDDKLALSKNFMPQTLLLFQLAYHTGLLLIHRPFLNEPKGSETLSFALRSATNAAASIARIVRAYRKFRGFAGANPQIIDYILAAAVIHLLNATSGRNFLGRQSAKSLRSCLDALVEIQNTWMPQASRAIRQIQELANRWKVVWALPLHLSQRLPEREFPPDHNPPTMPPQRWTSHPTSAPTISHDYQLGEIASGHMGSGSNHDLGDLWDPSLFENALEHVSLPGHIAYQSSLEWLFDESITGLGY
ncbi:hypothetical protein DSL72_006119 [Monilinia vaccinii-corymbosi]|uniref:Zn(2)-C6 fungal-type domain-containing protein n=1 Tax=Monilinia vaccinii-corymbosi TaxID=61207 RepID=A0A8A3PHL0_9HELO|nr:hypothetical protein DSL72_006119 [Monilinia vaccinii-corymbosi]